METPNMKFQNILNIHTTCFFILNLTHNVTKVQLFIKVQQAWDVRCIRTHTVTSNVASHCLANEAVRYRKLRSPVYKKYQSFILKPSRELYKFMLLKVKTAEWVRVCILYLQLVKCFDFGVSWYLFVKCEPFVSFLLFWLHIRYTVKLNVDSSWIYTGNINCWRFQLFYQVFTSTSGAGHR